MAEQNMNCKNKSLQLNLFPCKLHLCHCRLTSKSDICLLYQHDKCLQCLKLRSRFFSNSYIQYKAEAQVGKKKKNTSHSCLLNPLWKKNTVQSSVVQLQHLSILSRKYVHFHEKQIQQVQQILFYASSLYLKSTDRNKLKCSTLHKLKQITLKVLKTHKLKQISESSLHWSVGLKLI